MSGTVIINFSPLGILAFPGFDGCYLPKQENKFIHKVLEELEAFTQKNEEKSVLLFPALPSRLRFLIHKTAEKFPDLSTFSVGESWDRRVTVCSAHLRLTSEEGSSDTDGSVQEQPCVRKGTAAAHSGSGRSRGSRRPDKALYVPRALRQRAAESPRGEQPSLSTSEESGSDTTEPSTAERGVFTQVPGVESWSWPSAWDRTVSYFVGMRLDEQKEEAGEERHDDSAQTQEKEESKEFYTEITSHLKDKEVVVCSACSDYSGFENVWIDHEEFAHVIEIYDFPAIFKTEDLLDAFASYSEGGMKIKWLDNTHALGVFSSASVAMQALSLRHPLLKTRTLSEGSKKAKSKALRRAEFILPVKARPQTDTVVAQRMVTRALGLRGGCRGKRC